VTPSVSIWLALRPKSHKTLVKRGVYAVPTAFASTVERVRAVARKRGNSAEIEGSPAGARKMRGRTAEDMSPSASPLLAINHTAARLRAGFVLHTGEGGSTRTTSSVRIIHTP
jgi:hypothetical protein